LLSFNIAIPIYHAYFPRGQSGARGHGRRRVPVAFRPPTAAEATAQILRGAQIRYLGVGAMLVGGLWA
jgi:hypothetical protein